MIYFILALVTSAFAAPEPPPGGHRGVHPAGILRATTDVGDFDLLFEYSSLPRHELHGTTEVTIGSYYALSNNVRFGLFYRRAQGLRHDRDWITEGGVWKWRDTGDRVEDLAIFDISIKDRLLGSNSWVWEVKTRNFTNLYTGENTTMFRTGLSYFWLRDGELVGNLFTSYEFHFESLERWAYFGALYHVSEWLDIGPIGGLSWHVWKAPSEYIKRGGAPYERTEESSFLGVLALLTF